MLTDYFALSEELAWARMARDCDLSTIRHLELGEPLVSDEVIEISKTGDPSNRIDVVFMGDGYLKSQRDLMVDDMKRLVDDMFRGETFQSYLPVFNIWAVFRESQEEGIGVGSRPKNTAFRLYRDGTELRGIFPGDPNAARQACKATGANACDYPSLIGNDSFLWRPRW
eukprot:GABV01002648.1.p1 GENE.GABV01002648.1~~GABV01002648.1.p1  ORF type:complete len:179 (-),score=47.57 GABV01002648.1:133-639(-)